MILRGNDGLGRRATAASLTIAIHLGALVVALWSFDQAASKEEQPVLVAFTMDAPGPPAPEPPKPPQPIEVPPQPDEPIIMPPPALRVPTDDALVVALLKQADATGGACDLTAPVEAALQAEPMVAQTLPLVERDRRSVANALAVWNQLWIEADAKFPESALEAIRETVRMTVVAASDACRGQMQTGPRLMYLVSEERTTVLALGSGEWTWQQIADSAEPEFLLQEEMLASTNYNPRVVGSGTEKTLLDRIFGR